MSRRSVRSRSPMLLAGALLAVSLFGAGCKQGNGDRCEVASDCSSNYCSLGSDRQNGVCCDSTNLATCTIQTSGTGGASAAGGASGTGGAAGVGGSAGDSGVDSSTDSGADSSIDSAADSPTDSSAD